MCVVSGCYPEPVQPDAAVRNRVNHDIMVRKWCGADFRVIDPVGQGKPRAILEDIRAVRFCIEVNRDKVRAKSLDPVDARVGCVRCRAKRQYDQCKDKRGGTEHRSAWRSKGIWPL